ncbi:hypothetical protein ACJX0J_015530, partial [Zea mays]
MTFCVTHLSFGIEIFKWMQSAVVINKLLMYFGILFQQTLLKKETIFNIAPRASIIRYYKLREDLKHGFALLKYDMGYGFSSKYMHATRIKQLINSIVQENLIALDFKKHVGFERMGRIKTTFKEALKKASILRRQEFVALGIFI